jgi:glycine oxidase
MAATDTLIIGAGVTGCSIAYHLARLGLPSRILEREAIGARASGKSWGILPYPPRLLPSGGTTPGADTMFSTTGDVRRYLDLYWIGYMRMRDMAVDIKTRTGIDIQYGYSPNISVAMDAYEEEVLRLSLQGMHAQGFFEAEWLSANDIRRIYPDITSKIRGGLLVHNRQVETYKYNLGLAQAAESMGVTVGNGAVVGFNTAGNRVKSVQLASGREVEADRFVLTMGPWTALATRTLGRERPVCLNRDQCLVLKLPTPGPMHAIRLFSGNQIVPKTDGTIILGHAGIPDLQSDYDAPDITDEVKEELIQTSLSIMPHLANAEIIEHRGDLEGFGPAPVYLEPMIGKLEEWDNVYVAFRFGTMGVMASLGVGECMAELLAADGRIEGRYRGLLEYLSPANALH